MCVCVCVRERERERWFAFDQIGVAETDVQKTGNMKRAPIHHKGVYQTNPYRCNTMFFTIILVFLTFMSSLYIHDSCFIHFPGSEISLQLFFAYFRVFSLSQTTNFRVFQTERVRRQQFQLSLRCQKVLQIGRKHCGKKRNCSLQAIPPFPTVFSKDL